MVERRALVLIVVLVLAACAGESGTPTATPESTTSAAVTVEVTDLPMPQVTAEPPPDPELLAWIDVPQTQADAENGSRLALIDRTGSISDVTLLPPDTVQIIPCGTSLDGRYFALYIEGEAGALYLMDGTELGDPMLITYRLACFDSRTTQFSADGARFGVIDYRAPAFTQEYADGVLRLFDIETRSEIASFDDVTSFALDGEGAALVRFYQNANGEAAEAAITWWDGLENREILTLTPTGDDCRFTSAAIALRGDLGIVTLGHRCRTQGTDWQVYAVDFTGRIATLAASGDSGGAYFSYARTNHVWLSPDGSTVYLTVPDGVTTRTASLLAVNLDDLSVSTVIERQMLLPHHEDIFNRLWLSADGAWLAAFVTSPNPDRGGFSLDVVELDQPGVPLSVDLGLDSVDGVVFINNNAYYVQTTDNLNATGSLNALDLTLGTPRRIARGLFSGRLLLTPDQQTAALTLTDGITDDQPHSDLIGLNMLTGTLVTLYDGGAGSPHYAEALAWRVPTINRSED